MPQRTPTSTRGGGHPDVVEALARLEQRHGLGSDGDGVSESGGESGLSPTATLAENTGDEPTSTLVAAPWPKRLAASIIDPFLLFAMTAMFTVTGVAEFGLQGAVLLGLLGGLTCWTALLWYFEGATPSKRLLGLRVVGLDGEPVSFGRILAREYLIKWFLVWWFPPLAPVSWAMVIFDDQARALHDRLGVGTWVVVSSVEAPADDVDVADEIDTRVDRTDDVDEPTVAISGQPGTGAGGQPSLFND